MIPKLFHHCWPSGGPFPERFVNFRMSFMRHNPDWSFHFWTCAERAEYAMSATSEALQGPESKLHYVFRADLMRLEILYLYGGVYLDSDMECMKNFGPLLDNESFAGLSYNDKIGTAVIGTVPGNLIFKMAAEAVVDSILKHETAGTLRCPPKVSGPDFLMPKLVGIAKKYPVETFYPFHWNDLDKNRGKTFPGSYAVHWWNGMEPDGWTRSQ